MREKVFQILDELGIEYKNYEHPPVFTSADVKIIEEKGGIPGVRVKSLFLRNKKATQFYMVTIPHYKSLNIQDFRAFVDDTKISFGSEERMIQKIGVRPGSVSPFALLNNKEKDIKIYIDKELFGMHIGIHPLSNENTTVIYVSDLQKFLSHLGYEMGLYLCE